MEIERALKDVQSLEAPQHHAADFRNTLVAFLEAVSRRPGMPRYEAIQKGMEHARLSCAAGIAQHFASVRWLPSSVPARHAIVSRAREYMHAHRDEPLTVEELCQGLGVSRRALPYSFQAVLVTSPVAYLRPLGFLVSQQFRSLLPTAVRRTAVGNLAGRLASVAKPRAIGAPLTPAAAALAKIGNHSLKFRHSFFVRPWNPT